MNGLDAEGKPHGEHVTMRPGNRRTVVWYNHGVIHRDDKPAVTIDRIGNFYWRDEEFIKIYVQNGLVYRPVPAGANAEDYPSMMIHDSYISVWHSSEGALIRARRSTGKWLPVDTFRNTVTNRETIYSFDKRGFIKQIECENYIEFWSEDQLLKAGKKPLHLIDDTPASTPEEACAICLDNKKIIAFVPCGHATWCDYCASNVKTCPTCRATITSRLRIYT